MLGNMGSRYDAELTAEFGRCALEYGQRTGEKEYFERGAAALAAAAATPDVGDQSRARISGSLTAARARFGAAFVHVGRKWAVGLPGSCVRSLKTGKGEVLLDMDGGGSDGLDNRIVFGGMRGRTYRVRINGRDTSCSRADMEHGISMPSCPRKDRRDAGRAQGTLFKMV